ncbi:hypothetical protein KSF_064600 [Reticulibacter mediterranei]|uniref:Uncharacterized protein n=1 Tax=Reticulibacter mediterranei TaxID=2778369 RepID=A0A8J3N2X1_9CHLR|nr:hypothetical protein [Reticulibacter mediterranei]GHO96412.1 hypothetical protein KSF_064600 [Reticulibacter mediterranei]
MTQQPSTLRSVSRRMSAWLAGLLLTLWILLLFHSIGNPSAYSLTTWDLLLALVLTLELTFFSSIERIIQSHLPGPLAHRKFSTLLTAILWGFVFFVASALSHSISDPILLTLNGPFLSAYLGITSIIIVILVLAILCLR